MTRDLAFVPIDPNNPNGQCASGISAGQVGGPEQWLVGDVSLASKEYCKITDIVLSGVPQECILFHRCDEEQNLSCQTCLIFSPFSLIRYDSHRHKTNMDEYLVSFCLHYLKKHRVSRCSNFEQWIVLEYSFVKISANPLSFRRYDVVKIGQAEHWG